MNKLPDFYSMSGQVITCKDKMGDQETKRKSLEIN